MTTNLPSASDASMPPESDAPTATEAPASGLVGGLAGGPAGGSAALASGPDPKGPGNPDPKGPSAPGPRSPKGPKGSSAPNLKGPKSSGGFDPKGPKGPKGPTDPGDPGVDNPLAKKLPWPVKLFGVLTILGGAVSLVALVLIIIGCVALALGGYFEQEGVSVVTIVLLVVAIVVQTAVAALFLLLGIGLLRDRRKHGAAIARATMVVLIATLLLDAMISGLSVNMVTTAVLIGVTVALQSYLDPTLADERRLNRKLRRLEERADEEERLEHLRRYRGKAPYQLNFFNIFWTFVVCSVLGLIIETIHYFAGNGTYQDRAGLLFGPFSPIYGFGAVLMTLALNRIRNKNVLLIFLVSAVIGGVFEYFVSWFMQYAFGITAWDYTGTFLSIDGRTNGFYMACWGVLGVLWVRLLLPPIFKLIYLIPWDWRYTVTVVAAALMVADGVMTLQALDCWYERESGQAVETPLQEFYAEHFGDEYMTDRFQTMKMDTDSATRVDK